MIILFRFFCLFNFVVITLFFPTLMCFVLRVAYTSIFKRFYIYLFIYLFIYLRKRGREGEREGEKHQCVVASRRPPTGDLAHSPGMYPDWEWNWWPFGSQPTLNPLSYTSQGLIFLLMVHFYYISFKFLYILLNGWVS